MSGPTRVVRQVALGAIHAYQAIRSGRPSPCRFVPSCSTYAAEAVESHGLFAGGWLALKRLGRCRPHGGYGFDPVPN